MSILKLIAAIIILFVAMFIGAKNAGLVHASSVDPLTGKIENISYDRESSVYTADLTVTDTVKINFEFDSFLAGSDTFSNTVKSGVVDVYTDTMTFSQSNVSYHYWQTPKTLYTLNLAFVTVNKTPMYNAKQKELYQTIDSLAWYGVLVDCGVGGGENALPENVCTALTNLATYGDDMAAWCKTTNDPHDVTCQPYDGIWQQNQPYTIYLTTVNDGDGDYLNDWLTHLPVEYQHNVAKDMRVIVEYGKSINMPGW